MLLQPQDVNNIRVVCRFRPQNARENREGGTEVVNFDDEMSTVYVQVMFGCVD